MGTSRILRVVAILLLVGAALAQEAEEEVILGGNETAEGPDTYVAAAADAEAEPDEGAATEPPEDCDPEMLGFEIVTGYVFSAPADLLDSLPGTLMLTDCLDACQSNESCRSINYETGLCVLFKSDADTYPGTYPFPGGN